jgi:hypothetical protein
MVVLGRSVAGVSGYSSDKEGAEDATFLPELVISKNPPPIQTFKSQSSKDNFHNLIF